MNNFFDDAMGLDPLGPLPFRDPRWFIPAHGPRTFPNARAWIPGPRERFPVWRPAQERVDRLTRTAAPAPAVLRTTGFLPPDLAERVAEWFSGPLTGSADAVRRSYTALEGDIARLARTIDGDRVAGGLGVRVTYVHSDNDPYPGAAALCAELREQRSMTLPTIAGETAPHPLLGGHQGGVFDQLRVIHDVFGHAALGLGFDLQSEFATWLQCRALFCPEARGAAFCELVGAPTTYIVTGQKPALRADLPPDALVAACHAPR
jgi:hypothetical protein